ncbi:MAG: dTDP-4-dehydrorhamnose 3,5-epimerase family protein [Kiritimatiellae bacterium]|nr:dTDP-4-dehydrorhamnose 3,5-epimerase family protein [Kiritimatiellia bacterium]MDD5523045.1 dTDP-4-dehydrorhamnose 3,5-epimerase family protein [Kiritimatiellia bacterium]
MIWKEGKINGIKIRPAGKYVDQRGWLAEIFRSDEIPAEEMPAMGYVSMTRPGVSRGPHEHRKQTDVFGFVGPGNFLVRLWDNRKDSSTYGVIQIVEAGESNPVVLTVPPGIVHGYRNISSTDAMVFNFPDRLFAGKGKKQPVDEIRYENIENTPFVMNE